MRKVVWIRFQSILFAGIISIAPLMGSVPAHAQEEGSEEEQSTVVEATESAASEEDSDPATAVTVDDETIPTDELALLVKPLTLSELETEASAWQLLLQEHAQELADLEIAIKQEGEETSDSIHNRQLVQVTALQTEEAAIIDRFNTVLDALERKGGDPASYRTYIDAISGIELDLTDTQGVRIRLMGWLTSPEGGIRLGIGILKFGSILLVALFLSPRLGRLTDTLLSRVEAVSGLFRGFATMIVRRGVLVLGALLAVASLGVSLGPILALVGGASFVLAFALQSNLGNFASGLMLLVSKPFDVGDEVEVAGYWSYIHSISLANTKIKDFDGNLITIPNNTVWGGNIINYTHSDIRKLALPIHVKFTEDLNKIYEMWSDIANSHPKVLDDPAPSWFPWNAHYDYYIWVGLKAWARVDDYWTVYIDLLKELQVRLDEAGIELASPTQDIRLQQGGAQSDIPAQMQMLPSASQKS